MSHGKSSKGRARAITESSAGFARALELIMAAMDEVSVRIDDDQQFEDIPESGTFHKTNAAGILLCIFLKKCYRG